MFIFAAQPGVMYSYKNPSSYKKNNVEATKNLVEFTIKNKIKNLFFAHQTQFMEIIKDIN